MTINTNRNNVKPMLMKITPVVVFLCLIGTVVALQGIDLRQLASRYSIVHSTLCLTSSRMTNAVSFLADSINGFAFLASSIMLKSNFILLLLAVLLEINFAFITLTVAFKSGFTTFCLAICFAVFQVAKFTLSVMSIFTIWMFIKICKWFCLFANPAGFCFNWFRHNQLLSSWYCLEPLQTQYLCGLLYYTERENDVK